MINSSSVLYIEINWIVLFGIIKRFSFSDHSAKLYLIHLFLRHIKDVYISFKFIFSKGNSSLYSNDLFNIHLNPSLRVSNSKILFGYKHKYSAWESVKLFKYCFDSIRSCLKNYFYFEFVLAHFVNKDLL